ncbi:efflux RND transporter periplasmic adaptor subunit [Chitinophaga rhizophila]|uniref:Efflux RND transporter periplasmic adaptor subunit n=1 Tax=Chitinophaga rhizophila TaxID=2866212 RepID=A0ABS7G8M6_9BACT|nr:efflux RND transporter periplasmic adaptor subunit [Chitinophaga rhizophila]MBW8683480.1 efflux RND transporter periplasmic adaptor subunit [Chitinophaga rhizophila]
MKTPKLTRTGWLLPLLMSCNTHKDTTPAVNAPKWTKDYLKIPETAVNYTKFSGRVIPAQSVQLSFLVPGRIHRLTVKEGSKVKKGQLLMTLEMSPYKLQLDKARLQVTKLTEDYQRSTQLHNQGHETDVAHKTAEFALQVANTDAAMAAKNLSETNLYAPMDGVISSIHLQPGTVIGAGTPCLSIVSKNLVIEFTIPQSQVHEVRTDMACYFLIPQVHEMELTRIETVAPVPDPSTGCYTGKIPIRYRNNISVGMMAEVGIHGPATAKVFKIPTAAISYNEGAETGIKIVENGTIQFLPVSVRETVGDSAIVTLSEDKPKGQPYINQGQFNLSVGQKVF